jgi:hypothetical protein
MLDRDDAIQELGRLRNRHVAKLLSHLGAQPPYIEQGIKRSFSMLAQDVEDNIICSDKPRSQDHPQ